MRVDSRSFWAMERRDVVRASCSVLFSVRRDSVKVVVGLKVLVDVAVSVVG